MISLRVELPAITADTIAGIVKADRLTIKPANDITMSTSWMTTGTQRFCLSYCFHDILPG